MTTTRETERNIASTATETAADFNDPQDWRARGERNPIRQQMRMVRESAEELVKPDGAYHALMVAGPPGLGKNHVFAEVFHRHNITPRMASPGSRVGLIEDFYEAKDGILLFDEADKVLNANTINVLKKALDTEPANRVLVNNVKGKKKEKDHLTGKPFKVRCKSVFLLNGDLHNPKHFSPASRHHLSAITSRVSPFTITFDLYAMWEYTCYLAICEGLLKKSHHSLETANLALRYMTRTVWEAHDASPRRLTEIAKAIRAHPNTWEQVLDMRLPRLELRGSGMIPPIPRIVIADRIKTEVRTKEPSAEKVEPTVAEKPISEAVLRAPEPSHTSTKSPPTRVVGSGALLQGL